jgi:hypothetical protein
VRETAEDVRPISFGHAADHTDDEIRLRGLSLPQLAEARPHLLLGVLAHRAGVVDDDVGLLAIGDGFVALRAELAEDELAVEHVHLAAEGFEVQLAFHVVEAPRRRRANLSRSRGRSHRGRRRTRPKYPREAFCRIAHRRVSAGRLESGETSPRCGRCASV